MIVCGLLCCFTFCFFFLCLGEVNLGGNEEREYDDDCLWGLCLALLLWVIAWGVSMGLRCGEDVVLCCGGMRGG